MKYAFKKTLKIALNGAYLGIGIAITALGVRFVKEELDTLYDDPTC